MGFWSRLIGTDDEIEKTRDDDTSSSSDVTPPVSDVLLQALLQGEVITREKALTLPAVSGAVDFICNTVASMPVKLYKYKDGKVEEQEKDTRVKLLNGDTGDTLDAFQMKKAMVEDYLLGKGGYCYIQRKRNEVVALRYVEDIYITVLKNYKPIFKDFVILVEGNQYDPYEFIKLLRNTKDGASGVGLTQEVSKALETAYQTLLYQLALVQSGGNKKGFLKAQRRLGQDEINTLKTAWTNMYANNSENVVVLNNGLEFQEASNSSVEMQLDQNKNTLTNEINSIFHIYPDDFWQTFKEAIYPIVKAFETALNRDLLLEKEKKNHFFEFDVKEIVRPSLKDRYDSYKLAKETGFLTLNEIRRAENLSYIEGLDVVNVGLGAVLYDINEHKYYTPNTDTIGDIKDGGSNESQQEMDKMLENHELAEAYDESGNSAERDIEERFNDVHDGKTGRFGSKGGSGGSGSDSASGGSGGSNGGSRGQIDTGYKGQIPSAEMAEYNRKALEQIKKDTGFNESKAKTLQDDLQEYLGGDYQSFTRGEQQERVERINEGINKMPKYDGSVYRGMHVDSAEAERFSSLSKGDSIEMKSISSWSSKRGVSERYGSEGDYRTNTVMFECAKNKSGAGVQHISKWGTSEAEVLAPSTSKWKVTESKTQSKYDYLKKKYQDNLDKAKIVPKKNMWKKSLEDLETHKSDYEKVTITTIGLEEE